MEATRPKNWSAPELTLHFTHGLLEDVNSVGSSQLSPSL